MESTNGGDPKTAILYARVSTEEQAKKGYSLLGQMRQLREHAEARAYEVVMEAVDDGYEADTLWRPGVDRIRRRVAEGGVEVVLATERDRIARKRGYVFVLEEELREHGCALRALEDKDEESAEELLMRAIKDDFAEYEHAKITQRTFSKKLEKARGGEIIAGTTPNYGFRYNDERNGYLVDERKMPLVKRAFEMIGNEGQTSYSVIRWLEGADPHGPTGKGWNLPYLRKMVFNDVYRPHSFKEVKDRVPSEVAARLNPDKRYGIWWYNRRRFEPKRTPPKFPGDYKRKYRPISKPCEEWIGVPVPDSGIPPELVDAARSRVGKNKAPSKNGRRFWELSGNVVRCAECGYVTGTTSSGTPTNDYYYYRCRSKYNAKSGCTNGRGVRADILEREVWSAVSSALLHPDLLRAGLRKMIESERELLATHPAEQIAHWAKQVEKARIKRSRYQDQEAEGLMTREELRVKLAELEETIILAEGEIEKLRCHEERILSLEKRSEELLACYAELVPSEIESLCPEERRHIYQLLRVEVSVPKEGEIKIRLPFLPDNEGFCRKETAHCYAL
jgi:site-specific DNA recombinase